MFTVFAGREAEMSRLTDLVAGPLPRLVLVHGQAGIGKSAYLRQCRRVLRGSIRMEILDSREYRHIEDLTASVKYRIGAWPVMRRTILAIDAFDALDHMAAEVIDGFLSQISGEILVVLAARRPSVRLRLDPVGTFLSEIELGPLPRTAASAVLTGYGMTDHRQVKEVARLCDGSPLLLTLAGATARATGTATLDWKLGEMFRAEATTERAVRAGGSGGSGGRAVRAALEAAALVRRFDQDLLEAMLPAQGEEAFEALSGLSFVHHYSFTVNDPADPADAGAVRGAALHDAVRMALAGELSRRRPAWARELRRRAFRYLRAEAAQCPDDDLLAEDLLFLVSSALQYAPAAAGASGPSAWTSAVPSGKNGHRRVADQAALLRPTLFGSSPPVSITQPAGADWVSVSEIIKSRGQAGLLRQPTQMLLASAETDFRLYRAGFRIAWEAGDAVGYYNFLPVNRVTADALGADLQPWLRYFTAAEIAVFGRASPQDRPPLVIIRSVSCRPGREDVHGTLLRDTFSQFRRLRPACLLAIAPVGSTAARIAEAMRWEPLGPFEDQAGTRASSGLPAPVAATGIMLYIQRDWAAGFDTYIERLLGLRPGSPSVDSLPPERVTDLVKTGLETLYDLAALRESPLSRLRFVASSDNSDSGQALRDALIAAIAELESSPSGQQREAGALLRDVYVRRLASHTVVATRLGLPHTTFYRRLRQGIEAIATRLRTRELTSGPA